MIPPNAQPTSASLSRSKSKEKDTDKNKNSLSIRLTESVVFLRTTDTIGRRSSTEGTPSVLRGLLVLNLVKPTRITSIEIELQGKVVTSWPEGVGSRRVDVTEEHKIFTASTIFFRADRSGVARRNHSVGPGITLYEDNEQVVESSSEDEDELEGTHGSGYFNRLGLGSPTSGPSSRGAEAPTRPSTSVGSQQERGRRPLTTTHERRNSEDFTTHARTPAVAQRNFIPPTPPYTPMASSPVGMEPPFNYPSASSSYSALPSPAATSTQDVSSSDEHSRPHEDSITLTVTHPVDSPTQSRTPPLPPSGSTPYRSLSRRRSDDRPAQALQEYRQELEEYLSSPQVRPSQAPTPTGSPHLTAIRDPQHPHSSSPQDHLSRQPSIEDVPENDVLAEGLHTNGLGGYSPMQEHSPSPGRPSIDSSRFSPTRRTEEAQEHSTSDSPVRNGNADVHGGDLSGTSTTPDQRSRSRGRKHARFSFASVSNVLLDAVRAASQSRERERESQERVRPMSRGRSAGVVNTTNKEHHLISTRATVNANAGTSQIHRAPSPTPLERQLDGTAGFIERCRDAMHADKRSTLEKITQKLALDEASEGWKEFKKGVYTYPISITLPSSAPPTLECNFGQVQWRLKAQVHRPGTFSTKLVAKRHVIVIACPTDDVTEDTESINVERQWDNQLQYLITISGRSFYIGGAIPITFTIMPLLKAKVHRIAVILEERVDYHTNFKRVARSEGVKRIGLLSIKLDSKEGGQILPLQSDDPEAFRHSPLYSLISPDDDPSEVASNLMGPGPWTFSRDLNLPASCALLHFTNKNKRSNITVSHILRIVFRVERGDDEFIDPKTGKRKLFDIVVQTPVHILSCRCNPQWTSLPRYTAEFEEIPALGQKCPCQIKRRAGAATNTGPSGPPEGNALSRFASRLSTDSSTSLTGDSPLRPGMRSLQRTNQELYNRNEQFERLVAGQESESGEAPPAYEAQPVR